MHMGWWQMFKDVEKYAPPTVSCLLVRRYTDPIETPQSEIQAFPAQQPVIPENIYDGTGE